MSHGTNTSSGLERPSSSTTTSSSSASSCNMQIIHRLQNILARHPASAVVPQPDMSGFPEEPLDLSAEQGCGFFPARAGLLLNNGRYEILRKLGRGQYSSTWLVSDSQAKDKPQYYAAKILTVHATTLHRQGLLLELEILKAINELKGIHNLPRLFADFETDGPHGQHLCLVMSILSTDISSFRRSAPSKQLGLQTVKIIVVQVVESLVSLHAAHIIHTDVKPDNVLFAEGTAQQTIREHLDDSPISIAGEFELHGVQYPIILSQPIPHPFRWDDSPTEVELYSVTLTDLGNAQWENRESTTRTIGATGLRAPEVILGANFDAKVDIWSLGCMTFELLTGRWLFKPQSGPTWSTEDDHLAKMMELTGEPFKETTLSVSRNRDEYFDKYGKLLRIDQLLPVPLEKAMMDYGLPEAEVIPAANFLRACLHLNPEERSSASDLEAHPWLETAYMCC